MDDLVRSLVIVWSFSGRYIQLLRPQNLFLCYESDFDTNIPLIDVEFWIPQFEQTQIQAVSPFRARTSSAKS